MRKPSMRVLGCWLDHALLHHRFRYSIATLEIATPEQVIKNSGIFYALVIAHVESVVPIAPIAPDAVRKDSYRM